MATDNLPANCLCGALRRATRAVSRLYDEALAPAGLRITQYSVLLACQRLGAPTTAALARDLAMDRTTLLRNVGPLEERGLIATHATAGARAHRLALTAAGRRALAEAEPLWEAAQATALQRYGKTTMASLVELSLEVARVS